MKTLIATILTGLLAGTGLALAGDAQPTTCIVSGEKLGEMGKSYVFTYEGKEIQLCCKSCKKDFDKDPAKYLQKLPAGGH